MVRVLLCDDHDVVRVGLRNILECAQDIEIAGEASDGRAALELVDQLAPHVVVMDISMPNLNGLEATRRIREAHRDVCVIALSMHSDRKTVLEALKSGASGYVLKSSAAEELVPALTAVAAGGSFLSPQIAGTVLEDYLRHVPVDDSSARSLLSSRERDVLQLLAEGQTSKEIANTLHLSAKTVETHRAHIMDKLGVRTVAELTKIAVREGLTPP